MSKPTVARRPAAAKGAKQDVPLGNLAVTLSVPRIFENGTERVTISGPAPEKALAWVARSCPNVEYFTHGSHIAYELMGIADTCAVLGAATVDQPNPIFASIGDRLHDLACRLNAGVEREDRVPATVTIAPGKAVAA